jgi:hypothetical protein
MSTDPSSHSTQPRSSCSGPYRPDVRVFQFHPVGGTDGSGAAAPYNMNLLVDGHCCKGDKAGHDASCPAYPPIVAVNSEALVGMPLEEETEEGAFAALLELDFEARRRAPTLTNTKTPLRAKSGGLYL